VHAEVSRDWDLEEAGLRVDYVQIPPHEHPVHGTHDCIAIVAASAQVDTTADLLRQAGLRPIAADTTAGALARCIGHPQGHGAPLLIVDAASDIRVWTVARNSAPVFVCARSDGRDSCGEEPADSMPGARRAGQPDASDPELPSPVLDLALDTTSLLQYLLDDGHGHLLPDRGVLVGMDDLGPPQLSHLSAQTSLEFIPLRQCLPELVRNGLDRLPSQASVSDLVVPIGLAFYGCEHLLGAQ
jgi:hypothetical protein